VTAAVFDSRGKAPVLSRWEMRSEIGNEISFESVGARSQYI